MKHSNIYQALVNQQFINDNYVLRLNSKDHEVLANQILARFFNGTPPSKQEITDNPLLRVKYETTFTRLARLNGADQAKLMPKLMPCISIQLNMPGIEDVITNDERLITAKKQQEDQCRTLLLLGATRVCIEQTCTRLLKEDINRICCELGISFKTSRQPALDEDVQLEVKAAWKDITSKELNPFARLIRLHELFPEYGPGSLYLYTIAK